MKLNKKTSVFSKKNITVGVVILLCLAAAVAVILYFLQTRQTDPLKTPIDYSPPTTEQSSAGEDAKENAINRGQQRDTPPQSDSDPVSMEVAYDKANQRIVVTTKLSNNISWDTCHLEVSQGSNIKRYDARTVYQPSASFCGGFTVPTQGMTGTWNLKLKVVDLEGKPYEEAGDVTLN